MTRAVGGRVTVLVVGGGTAGHVEPALAVGEAVRRLDPGADVIAVGTPRGLETELVPARGFPLELVDPVPLPRSVGPDLAKVPPRLARAVRQGRALIRRSGADVVVGFGGYACTPLYLAAAVTRTPVVVHEANARAGLANRIGARFAVRTLAAVPGSGLSGADVVGNPVRGSLLTLDRAAHRREAREFFGLDPDRPVLLVVGGSQGARSLNVAMEAVAADAVAAGVAVLHATGARNTVDVPGGGADPAYRTVPYVDRMDLAYSAADLVLCRSGAITVAEVSAVGLPAVFVPLPIGNGEQALNSRPLVDAGAALQIADADLTAGRLRADVLPLLRDRGRLEAMSEAAARSGSRDAADVVARAALDAAAGRARKGRNR